MSITENLYPVATGSTVASRQFYEIHNGAHSNTSIINSYVDSRPDSSASNKSIGSDPYGVPVSGPPISTSTNGPVPALSSNNPFRKSTIYFTRNNSPPIRSPFDDSVGTSEAAAESFRLTKTNFLEEPRSQSVDVFDRPSLAVSPPPYSGLYNTSDSIASRPSSSNSSKNEKFASRQYSTAHSNQTIRKSTNPFLETPSPPHLRRTTSDDSSGIENQPRRPSAPTERSEKKPDPYSALKPEKHNSTRNRRSNSDSSAMEPVVASNYRRQDDSVRNHRSRDDKERREKHSSSRDEKDRRRHHHHHHHHKDGKETRSGSSRSSKKAPPLDTIDKLDVTGFFGPGLFHHDGPFDACTPHRNKNTKQAPVMAFPLDGANNTISGVDPNRDRFATENNIFGRGDQEAYSDFNQSALAKNRRLAATNPAVTTFDSSLKANPIHGDTTMGLGSSTFLEGAPASRIAINSSEEAKVQGLSRKKSLVQKLRGKDVAPRRPSDSAKVPNLTVSNTINGSVNAVNNVSEPLVRSTSTPNERKVSSPDVVSWGKGYEEASVVPEKVGLLGRVKSLKMKRRGS